jgi:hypothetical protein
MLCTGEEEFADDWRESSRGGTGSISELPKHCQLGRVV